MDLKRLKQLDIDEGTSGSSPADAVGTPESPGPLNAPTVTVYGDITVADVRQWGAAQRRLEKLKKGVAGTLLDGVTPFVVPEPYRSAGVSQEDVRNYCDTALTLWTGDADSRAINLGSATNQQMIDVIVACGILTSDDKSALMSRGANQVSPAVNTPGVGQWVGAGDLENARAL